MSVDVARVDSVANGAAADMAVVAPAGVVFPADGVCVDVREGSAAVSGWLVADREQVAALS